MGRYGIVLFDVGETLVGPSESYGAVYHRVLVELGLEDQVFRVEAVGTREPIRPRAHESPEAAENRRVEIILTEELVEEANTDADFTDPNLARGG